MIMPTILALDALLLEPANTCALRREPTERLVAGAGTSKAVGTVFAKSQLVIRRTAEDTWELVIRRSFADYWWLWLQDASAEYGLSIEA